ncbi:helix-turn-helix domain-containing protein [archaeon]|nr:MAG: helix-turn-helix domain-containing protein [archaeon]
MRMSPRQVILFFFLERSRAMLSHCFLRSGRRLMDLRTLHQNLLSNKITPMKDDDRSGDMVRTSTRRRNRVTEVKRIHILTLQEQGCKLSQIAHQANVKHRTVEAVLHKWKQHHTIHDLPKTGRPSKLDDRTKRRLARMALRGDVETATELAQTAAAHDIAHVSARTAGNMLHD